MLLIFHKISAFIDEDAKLFHGICPLKKWRVSYPPIGGPGSFDQPILLLSMTKAYELLDMKSNTFWVISMYPAADAAVQVPIPQSNLPDSTL